MSWALVAAGSALGGVSRMALVALLTRPAFPTGTLAVNVVGSLLVGWLSARLGDTPASGARWFLVTGFCGGFTTFSAFSLDALRLAHEGRGGRALLYVGASVLLSLAAVAAGWTLGRRA